MNPKFNWSRWLGGLGIAGAMAFSAVSMRAGDSGTADTKTAIAPVITPAEAQQAVASAKSLSTAFRVAADRVALAVVMIETKVSGKSMTSEQPMTQQNPLDGRNPFEGTPFEDFFKNGPSGQGFKFDQSPQPDARRVGLGSGVVIDTSGLIMTNSHVVAGGENAEVTVRLSDGREFKAADVWADPKTDIAIIRIKADGLTAAKIGNSDHVAVGDWVLALGQPFGLEGTVTAGIVSATHRGVGIADRESFLQTDAAINPGNSGGPLVNLDGEIVGINTAISSRSGGNEGIGFAVPINMANWVGTQLAHGGVVRRAYLGIGIQSVNATVADQFHIKPNEGVVVTEVRNGTPAAKAGIQSGDVITHFGGSKIKNPRDLQLIVEQAVLGQAHAMTVIRDGKTMTLSFTPEELPSDFGSVASSAGPAQAPSSSSFSSLGVELADLTSSVAKQLNLDGVEGVVITAVAADGMAAEAGLREGMVITQMDRTPVKSIHDCETVLQKADLSKGILLLVKSNEGSQFVVLKKS